MKSAKLQVFRWRVSLGFGFGFPAMGIALVSKEGFLSGKASPADRARILLHDP